MPTSQITANNAHQKKAHKNQINEINAEQFIDIIKNQQGKMLIDFYAPWCAPCKMIAPVVQQIAEENERLKVVKINADNSQKLMAQLGVRGLPTLLLINDGQVVGTQVGVASVSQVTHFINSHS